MLGKHLILIIVIIVLWLITVQSRAVLNVDSGVLVTAKEVPIIHWPYNHNGEGETLILGGVRTELAKYEFFHNYIYNKTCSFVIASSGGVNCTEVADQFVPNDCRFLAKLDVDRSFLDMIHFTHIHFCWGVNKNFKFETVSYTYDAWQLVNRVTVGYNLITGHSKWLTVHQNGFRKYIIIPKYDNNNFAVNSYKSGNIMHVLNVSPYYMPRLLAQPHDDSNVTSWKVNYKRGRYPFTIRDLKGKLLKAIEPTKPMDCERVYTSDYTFCMEAYMRVAYPYIAAYPRKYKITDAQTDEFEIKHEREKPSIIGSFFESIAQGIIKEIKLAMNLTLDGIENNIIKPVENYFITLIGRIIKFVIRWFMDLLNTWRETYLEVLISIDCKFMLVEMFIAAIIIYYFFPAYILTVFFMVLVILFLGLERHYMTYSPVDVAFQLINYISNTTYLLNCTDTVCISLYKQYCTNKG